jgi:hypothetical protein
MGNDFQYPDAWKNLGDIYGNMAGGGYTNQGMDWLSQLMKSGGGAFDQSGYDAANQPAMMDQFSNMTKEMAEQAGMGGTRYSSGLLNSIGNYGSQLQNQYNRDKWGNAFQGYEAGMGRAAGAGNLLSQLGLGAQQGGTEGLMGLGRAQGDYFTQAMNNMMGGGQYQNQMSIDPWTQMMAGMVGNPYYGQQTYNPSKGTDMLGILGSMPWGDIFGGKSPNLPAMDASGNFIPR